MSGNPLSSGIVRVLLYPFQGPRSASGGAFERGRRAVRTFGAVAPLSAAPEIDRRFRIPARSEPGQTDRIAVPSVFEEIAPMKLIADLQTDRANPEVQHEELREARDAVAASDARDRKHSAMRPGRPAGILSRLTLVQRTIYR